MSRRFFELTSAAALAAAVILAPGAANAQQTSAQQTSAQQTNAQTNGSAPKDSAKNWTMPRTPDGKPDLQGYFTNSTVAPLERPRDLGAKEFFTPEEEAAYKKKSLAQKAPTGPGTYADVHYDMKQFGLEKDQSKVSDTIRTSIIVGPDGRIPALLPAARERQAERAAVNKGHAFDGPETRSLSERCILWPNEGPPMMPVGYNSNLQIVQGEGYVAILQEMIHDVRIIPTDGRPHLPASVRELMGDSRGHWEGDTLVVDTTNFTDRTNFHGAGKNLHVVERFTRTGPNTVRYQFTVDDPETWAKPWSGELNMTKIDGPIFEYACNEGNYGMANNLSGARADEKKKAEEAALKPQGN